MPTHTHSQKRPPFYQLDIFLCSRSNFSSFRLEPSKTKLHSQTNARKQQSKFQKCCVVLLRYVFKYIRELSFTSSLSLSSYKYIKQTHKILREEIFVHQFCLLTKKAPSQLKCLSYQTKKSLTDTNKAKLFFFHNHLLSGFSNSSCNLEGCIIILACC